MKRNANTKAVLHCGDLGIYDVTLLERIPEREQRLLKKHNNPIEHFQPYLDGKKEFQLPIYAIPGNHEDFALVDELQEGRKNVKKLKLLQPGELIAIPGTPFQIMGLGKIFSCDS